MQAEAVHHVERAEDLDEIRAALGPQAKLYMIFARDTFALRYGPLDIDQVSDHAAWARREQIPFMITADCGATLDTDLIASMHGDTAAERSERAARRTAMSRAPLDALRVLGDNVAHLLVMRGDAEKYRLDDLRRRFEPIDRLAHELAAADDDGCPHDDPGCTGRADQCHAACDTPHRRAAHNPLLGPALDFYRTAVRTARAHDIGHEGSAFLEHAGALRDALIDAGVYPSQLETRRG